MMVVVLVTNSVLLVSRMRSGITTMMPVVGMVMMLVGVTLFALGWMFALHGYLSNLSQCPRKTPSCSMNCELAEKVQQH